MVDKIVSALQAWQRLTRAVESLLIDNIAATLPYLTPIVPSFLMYHNLAEVLGFPHFIALIGAVITEGLGLASIATAYMLWDYGDSKKTGHRNSPFLVAASMTLLYLLVVILVNSLLDAGSFLVKLAKLLLTLLTVVSGVILAIRSQHARRLAEAEQLRAERKASRQDASRQAERKAEIQNAQLASNLQQVVANSTEVAQIFLKPQKRDWRLLTPEEKALVAGMSTYDIQQHFRIPARTAANWRQLAQRNGAQRNGAQKNGA